MYYWRVSWVVINRSQLMTVADLVSRGFLVGQLYCIWWQLSVVLCFDVMEATVCMLMTVEILDSL